MLHRISEGLYEMMNADVALHNASDFLEGDTIYVRSEKTQDFIYIINLRKGNYKSFSLKSYIENADTNKKLNCMAGSKKGMTPYYLKDFLAR